METIKFGAYSWRVLEEQEDKTLIITEDIIEIRPYDSEFTDENDFGNLIWESCSLRQYLNSGFLKKFTTEEQNRIIETKLSNPNNLWYGVGGGPDTTDKIFLLSLEEADRYFGGKGDYLGVIRKDLDFDAGVYTKKEDGGYFSNDGDAERQASYEGIPAFWWLRSPGIHKASAAAVFGNGGVCVFGLDIGALLDVICGVRPALWLKKQ
ncbi:MAG: DUF6273 domain-containing protein [Oscillospiraceae bacterium]|nr:DUF6273 domain-containing protein [Oscillospiraceae bacterium]